MRELIRSPRGLHNEGNWAFVNNRGLLICRFNIGDTIDITYFNGDEGSGYVKEILFNEHFTYINLASMPTPNNYIDINDIKDMSVYKGEGR